MKDVKQVLEFIRGIDGWLSDHEGYFLYYAARDERGKGDIVEIGSWKGKSTICLASGSLSKKREKVYAVDPHAGEFTGSHGLGKDAPTYKEFLKNITNAGVKNEIETIITTSEDGAKKWKKDIRLLFIDGLHDYQHTHQDYLLWSPFLGRKGIIAFHDAFCGHIGPERVIGELFQDMSYSDFGVVGSIIYARKKEASTIFEKLNRYRHQVLIPFALGLNKSQLPQPLKFFLIHRLIKVLLLNRYTYALYKET